MNFQNFKVAYRVVTVPSTIAAEPKTTPLPVAVLVLAASVTTGYTAASAIEAVRCVANGVTDKTSVWEVNTEKEYHETEKKA